MTGFLELLRIQRWDDHRYYHHSQINQSLHLLSAATFILAYGVFFKDPAIAALIAWLVSMSSRQIGHLFFEPTTYDTINQVTHEHKEEIKVGYNLQRKAVLMTVWALSPLLLIVEPAVAGLCAPPATALEFARHLGYFWLTVGIAGLLFRTIQLVFVRDVLTGLVWATKIVTDPFHDIQLYYWSPVALLRGALLNRQGSDDYEQKAAGLHH